MHVLQKHLPFTPWDDPKLARLPGVQPLDPADWLVVDEAFAGQMALRDRLLTDRREAVLRQAPEAAGAALELLEAIVENLRQNRLYTVGDRAITRPDGRTVPLDRDDPLACAARLVQEDLCILQKHGQQHVLTAAALCFPASWTLGEKFMAPLSGIHRPVRSYDDAIARRVQRMFDMIRPEQPLWRANALIYADPALHQPRSAGARRADVWETGKYVRSERQCLLRLPQSGAVVFSIHTYVLDAADLTPAQQAGLAAYRSSKVGTLPD